ncbi:MAG TPA: PQQ-dependent sugar dehydrogenase [Myxococcales bacterium]|jgi:glucose/arabinose dehydrogenase
MSARFAWASLLLVPLAAVPAACQCAATPPPAFAEGRVDGGCLLVREGDGPDGTVPVRAQTVVSGLEVPWALAFLPGGGFLVSERPGRVRLFRNGRLQEAPVIRFPPAGTAEGGLMGLALHPDFAANRFLYLYRTTVSGAGEKANAVERWKLSEDLGSASLDRVIVDRIDAALYHDGGRIRFGPDGMLYVGTGDATEPERAQDPSSLNGKLLRLTPEGEAPTDNPFPASPVYLSGIRNTEGFDWKEPSLLYLVDHGPSGELGGRTGHDEVNLAKPGDNLGWPRIWGCQRGPGMVSPLVTWDKAVPPGGAALYSGDSIPEWRGSLMVGVLGAKHLHRVVFDPLHPERVVGHEVYFRGEPPKGLGRLREVVMGPDGALYVTTSNCDGRGICPKEKDKVVRVVAR